MTEIALQPTAEGYMASFQFEMEHYSPREFCIVTLVMNNAVSIFPVSSYSFDD